MNVLAILWRYKLFIVIVALLISTTFYKWRYDAEVKSLSDYKLTQQVLYDEAVKQYAIIKENSDKAITEVIASHKKQLSDLNLNRVREANKLKGSINEISDNLNIYRDSVSLRNESSSNNTLPAISKDTSGITETERTCYAQLATVIDACKVTDYDYEALYNAWDRACLIQGCQ